MIFKLKPDYILEHVTQIDIQELRNKGVKGLIFDLDNTIMPPKSGKLPENIEKWLIEASKDFKIAILTNNSKEEYLDKVREEITYPVYGSAKKPRKKMLKVCLKDMNLQPGEVAIIGDRPLTDIWVGDRLGTKTILVDPLMKNYEIPVIKLLRKLERTFIKEY